MKASELKQKDVAALNEDLQVLLKEQFNLRMQGATGQLAQNHALKKVRRNIARVKTVISEKQREGNA